MSTPLLPEIIKDLSLTIAGNPILSFLFNPVKQK